jgi:3-phenylpropionate/cinnamic acid dioxygenase small subunit
MDSMDKLQQDVFRLSTGLTDWYYHDVPMLEDGFFKRFLEIVGEENIHWITKTARENGGKLYHRGQAMISPQGKTNVRKWVKELEGK